MCATFETDKSRPKDLWSKRRSSLKNPKSCFSSVIFWIVVSFLLLSTASVARGEKFGALRLCPAGGRSFMAAWNLACEMKRKKRDTEVFYSLYSKRKAAPEGYRAATLTDIMNICCDVGCDIRDLLAYCDPFGPWNS